MHFFDFVLGVKNSSKPLADNHLSNLESLLSASKKFHLDAGIPYPEYSLSPSSFIVESGHQPNYFPHPGTFKKPFIQNRISEEIPDTISLFGFPDYNQSTAKILYKNKIPAVNKTGFESIGFNIKKEDAWKAFNHINPPAKEEIQKEIEKLKKHYKDISDLEELFWKSHNKATNIADFNAYLFTNILGRLGVNKVFFFRYSDLQKQGLFMDEFTRIASNLSEYNTKYNQVISDKKIVDMKPVESDHMPYWLDCKCGCKTPLILRGGVFSSTCLSCKETYSFTQQELASFYPQINPNAVARNLAYSNGLGVSFFVSGAGGGLRYGQISDELSKAFDFRLPATFAWRSRDYYLGPTHKHIMHNLMRTLSLESLDSLELITARINELNQSLAAKASSSTDKKEAQKYAGQITSLNIETSIAAEIFNHTPSFLDEYLSLGREVIQSQWTNAATKITIERKGDAFTSNNNIIYEENTDNTYNNLTKIGGKKE